ncbi:MAG: CBS domain-containing protein [Deltaproteobacteria bacterium]|nr:CBS domain-containing protein [Deltaproteobacteria bacterium]MBW2421351.1 CBS domain-containing protein [Deltaproteobacteria bacterium]
MTQAHRIPTAREIMTRDLVTLGTETCIFEAIGVLLKNKISGAPVVDVYGQLVGMLSEADCLRVLASGDFHSENLHDTGTVRDYMTQAERIVGPEVDIYALAHHFLRCQVRRFPVVDAGRLVGQVSRRDVLRGIETMRQHRAPRKHYPDYREPSRAPFPVDSRYGV